MTLRLYIWICTIESSLMGCISIHFSCNFQCWMDSWWAFYHYISYSILLMFIRVQIGFINVECIPLIIKYAYLQKLERKNTMWKLELTWFQWWPLGWNWFSHVVISIFVLTNIGCSRCEEPFRHDLAIESWGQMTKKMRQVQPWLLLHIICISSPTSPTIVIF